MEDNSVYGLSQAIDYCYSKSSPGLFKLEGNGEWFIIKFARKKKDFEVVSSSTDILISDCLDETCYQLQYKAVDSYTKLKFTGAVTGVSVKTGVSVSRKKKKYVFRYYFMICPERLCISCSDMEEKQSSVRLLNLEMIRIKDLPLYTAHATKIFQKLIQSV